MSVASPVRGAAVVCALMTSLLLGACGNAPAEDASAGAATSSSASASASAAPTVGQKVDGKALADAMSAAMTTAGSVHVATVGEDALEADLAVTGDTPDVRVESEDGGTTLLVDDKVYISSEPGSAKPWQSVDLLDKSEAAGLVTGYLTLITAALDPGMIVKVLATADVQVESVAGDTVTYAFTGKDPSGAEATGTVRVDRESLPAELVLKGADGATVTYTLWGEVDPPLEAPAASDVEQPTS